MYLCVFTLHLPCCHRRRPLSNVIFFSRRECRNLIGREGDQSKSATSDNILASRAKRRRRRRTRRLPCYSDDRSSTRTRSRPDQTVHRFTPSHYTLPSIMSYVIAGRKVGAEWLSIATLTTFFAGVGYAMSGSPKSTIGKSFSCHNLHQATIWLRYTQRRSSRVVLWFGYTGCLNAASPGPQQRLARSQRVPLPPSTQSPGYSCMETSS